MGLQESCVSALIDSISLPKSSKVRFQTSSLVLDVLLQDSASHSPLACLRTHIKGINFEDISVIYHLFFYGTFKSLSSTSHSHKEYGVLLRSIPQGQIFSILYLGRHRHRLDRRERTRPGVSKTDRSPVRYGVP